MTSSAREMARRSRIAAARLMRCSEVPALEWPTVGGRRRGVLRRADGGCHCNSDARPRVPMRVKNEAVIGGIVVGGQPDAADVQSGRFACVINCRPDDEAGNVSAELVRGTDIAY